MEVLGNLDGGGVSGACQEVLHGAESVFRCGEMIPLGDSLVVFLNEVLFVSAPALFVVEKVFRCGGGSDTPVLTTVDIVKFLQAVVPF